MKKLIVATLCVFTFCFGAKAQQYPTKALEIQSILVDACNFSSPEQDNEMFTFKVGPDTIKISNLVLNGWGGATGTTYTVNSWPSSGVAWAGLIQSAATSSVTANLQATITNGCGKLIEPPLGKIPPHASVLVVSSINPSTTDNSFAALTDTLYIVYHNSTGGTAHFKNSYCSGAALSATPCAFTSTTTATATRSMILKDNGTGMSDTVSYQINLLTNTITATPYGGNTAENDGATVEYAWPGYPTATYVNNGCKAPFIPLSATASTTNTTICSTATASITGAAGGSYTATTWSGGAGTFGNIHSLNTSYTPGAGESGQVILTLTVYGKCLGATATSTVAININAAPTPTITSSKGAVICNGSGTVLTASSTSTLTTTWVWAPGGATTSTISVSPPTGTQIYTVTGTNSCGSAPANFTVTTNALPTITILNDSICANVASGTLTATGTSTTYTWNNGVQTASITAAPGTYSVTGTDGNSCVNTATASIVSINLPHITTNVSSVCVGVTNTLTASGGAANSYTWSAGGPSGNNTYIVTPANTNPIVVTGAEIHGCLNTQTVTVNASPTITVNSPPPTCSGQAVTLQANPTTLTSYTWTGVSSSSSTASVAPSSNASYTVSGTDANGCVSNNAISNVTISTTSQISVNQSSNFPCINSTYTLTANGATTYTWVPSAGTFTSLDANSTQISVTQGTAAVTFTVNGTGSCPATQTVVTISPAPVVTLTITSAPSATVCKGNPVTLTASGASSYTWAPVITNGTAFTPTTSATYTVNATDINNCSVSSTVAVTVNNLPTFTVNSPSICAGQTATLTASDITYTYTWQGSASAAATITVTPSTSPQTYTVSALDGNGCTSNIVTTSVSTYSLPTISITANPVNATICAGGTITLSGNGAITYTWTGGVVDNTVFTPPSSPLTQTYSVSGTDVHNCVNVVPQTVTVTVNPISTLSVTALPVCVGDSSHFIAIGASSYVWSTSAMTSTITVLAANNQTYTVVGVDANICPTAPFVVTATVNALPTVTITPSANSVCAGSTVTLTASGAGATNDYTWSDGSTNTTLIDNPTTPTSYTVTGVDANNCSNSSTVTINVNPLPTQPVIVASNTIVCIGAINPATVLSSTVAGTWIGPAPSTATISANSTSISVAHGGAYTLITSNSCGQSPAATYTLAADSVIAGFNASPLTGQTPLSVGFTNTSVALPGNTLAYNWAFGDGNHSISTNPTNIFTGAATYQTTLTAVDNLGCIDTATIYIVVKDIPTVLIIPNVFSPNGDNINDMFMVTASGISNFDCKVYDRWGLLLYEWEGVDGGWDGKAKNGSSCTEGTYFYLINYTDNQNKSYLKQGFVTLVR